MNSDGSYKSNLLSDVQIALAAYIQEESTIRNEPLFAVNTIDKFIVEWWFKPMETNNMILSLSTKKNIAVKDNITDQKNNVQIPDDEKRLLKSLFKYGENYRIKRNADIMMHVNRGTIGLRLDNVKNAILQNISIENIENIGK
jgi:hypothetical protein